MRAEHQEDVGTRIARLRAQRGWSQRELAGAVGLDQSAVSRVEAGRRRVSAAELQRFADLFHVSADALLGSGSGQATGTGRAWGRPDYAEVQRSSAARATRPASGEHELLTAIERARHRAAPRGESGGARRAPGERPLAFRALHPDRAFEHPDVDGFVGAGSVGGAPPLAAGEAPVAAAAAPGVLPLSRTSAPLPPAASPGPEPPGPDVLAGALPAEALRAEALQAAQAALPAGASARTAGEDWAAAVAGVVRDWFVLRELTEQTGPDLPWSTGQTAEGKPAFAARPWQPVIPPPGAGDVLYDRVARFWRGELHVEPDDGPVPDLVPLVEDGLGVQVVVARVSGPEPELAARIGIESDPHPVAATVVEDGVPFVFVNAGRPVVLQRFALVHAFAHLVLGHGDVVDESIGWSRANPREAAANDFAEEFLAPVRAVDRWYGRRQDLPRNPGLDTLLELANAFGISAWAALFRSRAAGRLHVKQFTALRSQMKHQEWELLPRQAFLGGPKDTLAHLTPAEVLPVGEFGPPAVLRVPACMRARALAALRDGRLSLEDAAAMLHLRPGALAEQLDALGLA